MNDRKLLELAARAAGHESKWDQPRGSTHGALRIRSGDRWSVWNPLADDGDALRLAVKLHLDIQHMRTVGGNHIGKYVYPTGRGDLGVEEPNGIDEAAATRRAITRAAAEIGKNMDAA
ncbi:hypothetical protein [Burkholderia gladioli]|uniref:hypothetical protein n=1 Tax=Burkholderia gladioli TaxID=28095 RepID=UPI0034DB068F